MDASMLYGSFSNFITQNLERNPRILRRDLQRARRIARRYNRRHNNLLMEEINNGWDVLFHGYHRNDIRERMIRDLNRTRIILGVYVNI